MSDDSWSWESAARESTSRESADAWEGKPDPWFAEPEWPVRKPTLPAWSARRFEQQAVIPAPRRSSEWL
jgi:hypothetical protein